MFVGQGRGEARNVKMAGVSANERWERKWGRGGGGGGRGLYLNGDVGCRTVVLGVSIRGASGGDYVGDFFFVKSSSCVIVGTHRCCVGSILKYDDTADKLRPKKYVPKKHECCLHVFVSSLTVHNGHKTYRNRLLLLLLPNSTSVRERPEPIDIHTRSP